MNLPPVLKQRYLDSNGVPLAGGLLYSYQAGTTTPQATYTDQTGATPNTNPIVLDSAGYAAMWLDPSLSYKFVLQDSLGNVQWTVDNVIGLLTANAVNTASIQDGAITSSKLATGAVNAAALAIDASVDANRPVNTNNIRDSAITTSKIATGAVTYPKLSGLLAPTAQTFTSGSGVYNKTYLFAVSSANASLGATYTINSVTYTVSQALSSGNLLQMTGPSAPPASGTLTRASGTGDASIVYTSFAAPLYLRVKIAGGGGGGGGGATGNGAGGGAGGATTFGNSLLTANGGGGGASGAGGTIGGAGGTVTINSPAIQIIAAAGGSGMGVPNASVSNAYAGGAGGANPLGGSGAAAGGTATGAAGLAGTGAGGGGGGGNSTTSWPGNGGGAGGFIEALIPNPAVTYSYAVGGGGVAGASTSSGGAGGSGIVIVEEYYQ